MPTSGHPLSRLSSVAEESQRARTESVWNPLLGDSEAMRRLRLQIERIGPHFRTVLVRGEIGTGKKLIARALHQRSGRRLESFVACNAASLNELTEIRGGNQLNKPIRSADAGTLFIDGVESLCTGGQRRLLRMLEEKIGTQMIVATAGDLCSMAAEGQFRQNLYHRLAMVQIVVEPLRNRPEDIQDLAMHFLERFVVRYDRNVKTISAAALERLQSHGWPENVRELGNMMRNAVLQCEGCVLEVKDLSPLMRSATSGEENRQAKQETSVRLQDVVEQHVVRVLRECSGNKVRAAEVLGISRSTLYRMLEGCSVQRRRGCAIH